MDLYPVLWVPGLVALYWMPPMAITSWLDVGIQGLKFPNDCKNRNTSRCTENEILKTAIHNAGESVFL